MFSFQLFSSHGPPDSCCRFFHLPSFLGRIKLILAPHIAAMYRPLRPPPPASSGSAFVEKGFFKRLSCMVDILRLRAGLAILPLIFWFARTLFSEFLVSLSVLCQPRFLPSKRLLLPFFRCKKDYSGSSFSPARNASHALGSPFFWASP